MERWIGTDYRLREERVIRLSSRDISIITICSTQKGRQLKINKKKKLVGGNKTLAIIQPFQPVHLGSVFYGSFLPLCSAKQSQHLFYPLTCYIQLTHERANWDWDCVAEWQEEKTSRIHHLNGLFERVGHTVLFLQVVEELPKKKTESMYQSL